jgi:outer membrane protein, heavy metal efflux system
MVECPRHRETKQDANPLMRSCLVSSILTQLLSMIAGSLALAGEPQAAPPAASSRAQSVDPPLLGGLAEPAELRRPLGEGVLSSSSLWDVPSDAISVIGGTSLSLQMALYGTLTCNPDLNILRLGNPTTPSAESVEVARHFPTTLNPTLWIDYRPIILIPPEPFGGPGGAARQGPYYHWGQQYVYLSLRQPIELGHQTTHRYHIAQAAYEQQRWIVVQAELRALVQTYRFFQTAVYRREKFKIARELSDFNEKILKSLQNRLEANLVPPAEVILARVESRASRQLAKAAQQDYIIALADLRNQIGIADTTGAAEPVDEFALPPCIPPVTEKELIEIALENRPDIHAARAVVAGTKAAENLARADRIPSPIIGPQYETDEAGLQYIGFVFVSAIPVWNSGSPLQRQREAEHCRAHQALQQAQQRVVAQVRSGAVRWNGAVGLVKQTRGLSSGLARVAADLEDLFQQGQADLTRLLQAQQRVIQLKNTELDALWAASQAQADLLLAVGAPTLIQSIINQTSATAVSAAGPAPSATPAAPPSPVTSAVATAPKNPSTTPAR